MRSPHVLSITLLALTLISAPPARAQGTGSAELGIDMAFALTMFDDVDTFFGSFSPDNAFSLALPMQSARIGIYASDRVQIEPSLGFQLVSQGGESVHVLQLGLDALFGLSGNQGGSTPFVSFGGGMVSVGNGSSTTQANIRAGVGVKVPAGDRFAVRLHALGGRAFETDEAYGTWEIGGRVGVSYFTK